LRKHDELAVEATGNTSWFVEQIRDRVSSKEKAQLHSLAGTRDKLVKQHTALINKIHNVLINNGTKYKKESLSMELNDQISERGKNLKGHENLSSIKGIGERSATVLLSVIDDVNDFADSDKLVSYFGIVPRVSDSNATVHHGRITKNGSKIARTTLIQCTLAAKRYSPYLRRYYERIERHRGSGKAIIATARKFLGIIYQTLKNDRIFEDFPNFVIANT